MHRSVWSASTASNQIYIRNGAHANGVTANVGVGDGVANAGAVCDAAGGYAAYSAVVWAAQPSCPDSVHSC